MELPVQPPVRVLLTQPSTRTRDFIAEESSNSVSESLEMTSYFRLLPLKSAEK